MPSAGTATELRFNDAAITTCLVSLPPKHEPTFFQQQIVPAFQKYRERLQTKFTSGTDTREGQEMAELFYKPLPFFIFGRFDLAVLSLVDDYELLSSSFLPFNPDLQTEVPYSTVASCKVLTGSTPLIRRTTVVDNWTRFSAPAAGPLFGLSFLKLNSSLLFGSGTLLLRGVIEYLATLADEAPGMSTLILGSNAWHELTLAFRATDYAPMTKFILEVRELTVRKLLDRLKGIEQRQLAASLESAPTLLSKLCQKERRDPLAAHVLYESETTLGFDLGLFDGGQLDAITTNSDVRLSTKWSVKPGHLGTAAGLIDPRATHAEIALGRGDLILPANEPAAGGTQQQVRSYITLAKNERLLQHVHHRRTFASTQMPLSAFPPVDSNHGYFSEIPSRLVIAPRAIHALWRELRAVGTPKTLSQTVINMLANFNDGISDRNMYGFFVELRPFMDDVLATVKAHSVGELGDLSLKDWCRLLRRIIENFDMAYANRFHNSDRMGDLTDFNIDFKGGIQQVLSGYDAAYKAVSLVLGHERSFAYVSSDPGVHATGYEIRLNSLHVSQPETLLAVIHHEAANWFVSRQLLRPLPEFVTRAELQFTDIEFGKPWGGPLANAIRNITSPDAPVASLLGLIDRRFAHYLLVDALALQLGYNGDCDLMAFWYIGTFSQMPVAYERAARVDDMETRRFLLKLLLVCSRDGEVTLPPTHPVWDWSNQADSAQRETLLEAIRCLWRTPEVAEWLRAIHTYGEELAGQIFGPGSGTSNETPLDLERLRADITSNVQPFKRSLADGVAPVYVPGQDPTRYRFCHHLFLAYLTLLREEFGNGNLFLTRPELDGLEPKIQDGDAALLFDSRGGVFTHDPVTRRKLFKYRSTLAMSLWDLSVKEKQREIESYLSSVPRSEQG